MPHPIILWDASGFVKRYFTETGTETVNAIFASTPRQFMAITPLGYAETYSILLRRYNGGVLKLATFNNEASNLKDEVLGIFGFRTLSVSDAIIFGSLLLMQAHNINSAEAAILATYLRFQKASRQPCLLVASDKRLLRAAMAEGLNGLNPEEVAAGDIPGWVSL